MSAAAGESSLVPAPVRVQGPGPAALGEVLRRSWRVRARAGYFGRRFNEKRYLRTWLGAWWLPLRPGMTIAWQMFVFTLIAPVSSGGDVPYAVPFLLAFATWSFFAEGAFWATRSLELNRRPLKVVAISPLVVLVAALVPAIVDLLIVAGFLVLTLAGYAVADGQLYLDVSAGSVSIFAGFALLSALALGVGLLLAVPGARFRDIRFGLRFVLGIWYFATPVIYPVSAVPAGVRTFVEINPVTAPVELIRSGLLDAPGPSALALASCCVLTSGLVLLGFRAFARGHGRALDHL